MFNFIKYNSLKTKLILSFTAVLISLSIAICVFYYYNERQTLEKNIIESSYSDIRYLSNNIEKQLKLCEKLSDWVYVNRRIEKVLIRDYTDEKIGYNVDIPVIQQLIDDQLASASIGKYIASFIIMGNNGVCLSVGNDPDWTDKTALKSMNWFIEAMNKNGRVFWNGIVENPAQYKSDKYIIPIVRPVIFADTHAQIGWSMIGFKPALISDVFEEYKLDSNHLLFVVDNTGKAIFHNESQYIGQWLTQYDFMEDILSRDTGDFIANINNKKMLVCFFKSKYSGMTIIQALSYEQLEKQKEIVRNISLTVLILSIAISAVFTVFLSSRLTKPLRNLLTRMKYISSGNFGRDASLEGADEMGILGKGINDMADNIKGLMDTLLEKEREKKRLELKMLQSQINPHFIYNTLHSIKLMATIQKSDGISEMVSALGLLLKEVSKGTSEKITLREEIKLVDNYIYIQKIRCRGLIKVQYQIPDEDLYNYRILKFTLQPIVENAIVHGLESKEGIGVIRIELMDENDKISISVEDNGIGMTAEKLREIFSDNKKKSVSEFNSIGIKNVDERLKLTYGNQYGLKIESREGEYTRVLVVIPKEI